MCTGHRSETLNKVTRGAGLDGAWPFSEVSSPSGEGESRQGMKGSVTGTQDRSFVRSTVDADRSRPALLTTLVLACLFTAGFCGLAYELLYARILTDHIGDRFAVNAALLITFLTGIGIGSLVAHRFAKRLWAIQLSIGAYALAFLFLEGSADAMLAARPGAAGLVSNIATCCLVLLLPATLIGMALPLFASVLKGLMPGRAFGRTYSLYNYAAALTVLFVEFGIIRATGIRGCFRLTAAATIAIGVVLFLLRNRIASRGSRPTPAVAHPTHLIIALAISSVASAAFQLWLLKIAEFVSGPFRQTFALVLAISLGGIAIGSTIAYLFNVSLAALLAVNAVMLCSLMVAVPSLLVGMSAYNPGGVLAGLPWGLAPLLSLLLVVGSACCFGATVPTLMRRESDVARESGFLLFIASAANVFGYLLMVFVLHPRLEYGAILSTIIAALGLAAAVALRARPRSILLVAAFVALAILAGRRFWSEDLLYLEHTAFRSRDAMRDAIHLRDSEDRFRKYDENIAISRAGGEDSLYINGYKSIVLDLPAEATVGALSSLVSPRRDKALVLGLGSGGTAGAVSHVFRHTDIVEISPLMIEKQPLMARYNLGVTSNENAHIYCDDGVRFLGTTRESYDLVVNTVTTPIYFSSGKLYTRDFLRKVKARLAPDGVYTTWVDCRAGDRGLRIMLTTLASEFKHCWASAIRAQYFLLLCSNRPLELHNEAAVYGSGPLRKFFRERHGLPVEEIRYAIIDPECFAYLTTGTPAPVNTIDLPALEFEMASPSATATNGMIEFQNFVISRYSIAGMNSNVFSEHRLTHLRLPRTTTGQVRTAARRNSSPRRRAAGRRTSKSS